MFHFVPFVFICAWFEAHGIGRKKMRIKRFLGMAVGIIDDGDLLRMKVIRASGCSRSTNSCGRDLLGVGEIYPAWYPSHM